jgi:hypothetical protein
MVASQVGIVAPRGYLKPYSEHYHEIHNKIYIESPIKSWYARKS